MIFPHIPPQKSPWVVSAAPPRWEALARRLVKPSSVQPTNPDLLCEFVDGVCSNLSLFAFTCHHLTQLYVLTCLLSKLDATITIYSLMKLLEVTFQRVALDRRQQWPCVKNRASTFLGAVVQPSQHFWGVVTYTRSRGHLNVGFGR